MIGTRTEEADCKFEIGLLIFCGLIFAVLLVLDLGLWHPGFSYFDEGANLGRIQDWLEGQQALPYQLFKGSIYDAVIVATVTIFGKTLLSFRLVSVSALILENFLMHRLARRNFGGRVAVLTVLVNLVSAFTFLRSRSLLSFCMMPAELLVFEALLHREFKARGSFLWGLGIAVLLTDYEGWILCCIILFFLWMRRPKESRPKAAWTSLGFGLGLAVLLAISWSTLSDYFLLRSRTLPQGMGYASLAFQFFRSFFYQAPSTGYLGITGHPFFSPWALPGLLLGMLICYRNKGLRWLLVWGVIGILPALTVAAAKEPNRILAAWPALCMVAALGLETLMDWLSSLIMARVVLTAVVLLGGLGELTAYDLSMRQAWPVYYAESAAYMRLGERFRGRPLVNELGDQSASNWRFLWPSSEPGANPVYVFPPEYSSGLGKDIALLKIEPVAQGQPSLAYLDKASPALAARLNHVAAELTQVHRGIPRWDYRKRRYLLERAMDAADDAWVRTEEMEEALRYCSTIGGEIPPRLLQQAMRTPLVSSTGLLWLAYRAHESQNEPMAQSLCTRALQIDPSRPCSY